MYVGCVRRKYRLPEQNLSVSHLTFINVWWVGGSAEWILGWSKSARVTDIRCTIKSLLILSRVKLPQQQVAVLMVFEDCLCMIGLLYSKWSYWIRQSQSVKTVFALRRSPSSAHIPIFSLPFPSLSEQTVVSAARLRRRRRSISGTPTNAGRRDRARGLHKRISEHSPGE